MTYYPPLPPQPPQRKQPGPLRSLVLTLGAVTLAALIGVGFLVTGVGQSNSPQSLDLPGGSSSSSQSSNKLQSLDADAVAQKVDPGLVDINTTLGYQQAQAAGTGMVLTSDGEVLTNNHVVEGATSISVTDIGNGKTYKAKVVGYDRSEDVAVLQLENASGLSTVTTGDSSQVATGDAIVGIGNAGGTGGTPSVAAGTVSALNQSITASDESSGSSEQLDGLIQVNANIQSGDSGGALADSNGKVIGMNTAASTGYQFGRRGGQSGTGGTGFAIPINQALSIAKQITAGTASDTVHIGSSAFLGVSVSDAQEADPNSGQTQGSGGALIQQTVAGGPADEAGLQAGDTLTGINGKSVDSATALTTLMDTLHPGDKITVTYLDQNGQQQSTSVTVIEGPVG